LQPPDVTGFLESRMISDDFDDDRDGAGLEDPEDPENPLDSQGLRNPSDSLGLDEPVISRNPRRSVDSTDQDDSRDLDYSPDEPDDEFENFINRTYVCEDCDFRWAEKIYPERNDFPDYDDEMGHAHICPMCGSVNVSFY
jgi:hypothetical protein